MPSTPPDAEQARAQVIMEFSTLSDHRMSAAIVTLRMLIRRATPRYRWDGRPTTRRLK